MAPLRGKVLNPSRVAHRTPVIDSEQTIWTNRVAQFHQGQRDLELSTVALSLLCA